MSPTSPRRRPKLNDWTGPRPGKTRQRTYCGALVVRTGRPCKSFPVGPSGRCRVHSGLGNSGPRTPEGKARVGAAVATAHAEWRKAYGLPPEWRSTANRVCRQKRERFGLTAASYLTKHGPHKPEEPAT
jgi:hypothetical protein